MGQIRFLGILAFIFLFFGIVTRNGTLVACTLPFIVWITIGLLSSPQKIEVSVTRTIAKPRAVRDEPIEITVTLQNNGNSLEEVMIEDVVPEGLTVIEGNATCLTTVPEGDRCTFSYTVRAGRGYYQFGTTRITVRDRLGLVLRTTTCSAHGELYALPERETAAEIPIKPEKLLLYTGPIPSRTGGEGVQFFDIREYQPGDHLRHINWRASARRPDHLFTNEYEMERITEVGIILDARLTSHPSEADEHLFEKSVVATSSLAQGFLNAGHRVGLLIYGQSMDWTFPGYGKQQREKILTALSTAKIGSTYISEKLDYLPTRLFPAKSQLILVSPLLREDIDTLISIHARGYSLFIVSPDPVDNEIRLSRMSMLSTTGSALHDHYEMSGSETYDRQEMSGSETYDRQEMSDFTHRITTAARKLAAIERKLIIRDLERASIFVLDWKTEKPFGSAVASHRGKMNAWLHKRGLV